MKINTIIKACACGAALAFACEASAEVIAYWPFGANGLNDVSGNGNNLVADSHISVVNDDNCASLDGLQELFNTVKELDFGETHAITVEYWFKFDRTEAFYATCTEKSSWAKHFYMLELSPDVNYNIYSFRLIYDYRGLSENEPGRIESVLRTLQGEEWTSYVDTFADYGLTDDGEWHHVAVEYQLTEQGVECNTLYIDKENVYTANGNFSAYPNPERGTTWPKYKLFIGSHNNYNCPYKGEIDDIRISSGCLAPEDFVTRSAEAGEKQGGATPIISNASFSGSTVSAASFTVTMDDLGEDASVCDIYAAYELGGVTVTNLVIENIVDTGVAHGFSISNLVADTLYKVRILAKNDISDDYGEFGVSIDIWTEAVKIEPEVLGLWTFGRRDFDGTLVSDRSGNGNNLTVSAGVTVADDIASLDGSGGLKVATSLDMGGIRQATAECWAKFTADRNISNHILVEYGEDHPAWFPGSFALYYVNEPARAIRVMVCYDGEWQAEYVDFPFEPDGGWHHFAVVINAGRNAGKSAYVYIDGALKTSLNWFKYGDGSFHSLAIGHHDFTIGCNSLNWNLVGEIDDVRLCKGALTPDQFLPRTTGIRPLVIIVR